MRLFLLLGVCSLLSQSIFAQELVGFSTRNDDSFSEWVIYTAEEDLQGELTMRWRIRNDWSEWDYRLGEEVGSIKVKWKDDANLWELRADNSIVTIRTVYKDDWRQWEVRASDYSIDVESKYGNILEEWSIRASDLGTFEMFTSWEGDLRDWVIEDRLGAEVSVHTKIALAFIPILYSTPKY